MARRSPAGVIAIRSSCGMWPAAVHRARFQVIGIRSTRVAFAPDGKTLASGELGQDDQAVGCSRPPRRSAHPLRAHGSVYSVAFAPDGKTVASVSGDDTIKLWDEVEGQRSAHTSRPRVWCQLGQLYAGREDACRGGDDHTIKLWDVASGVRSAHALRPHGVCRLGRLSRRMARRSSRELGTRRSSCGMEAAGKLLRTLSGAFESVSHLGRVFVPMGRRSPPGSFKTGRSSCGMEAAANSCAHSPGMRVPVYSVAFAAGWEDARLRELGRDDQAVGWRQRPSPAHTLRA